MAVAVFMHWDGVTADQYDQLREIVNWEGNPPTGGKLHFAAFDETGVHIADLWETADEFQAFVGNRLMPGVAQLGIPGEPTVTVLPAHAIFAPNV